MTMMLGMACVIYFTSGLYFTISMLVGAITCLMCSTLGINMNFEGGPRVTHALNYDLVTAIRLSVRTGAIGGLSAHAMAQLGVVIVWMLLKTAEPLIGFGSGVSVVAFYTRIG